MSIVTYIFLQKDYISVKVLAKLGESDVSIWNKLQTKAARIVAKITLENIYKSYSQGKKANSQQSNKKIVTEKDRSKSKNLSVLRAVNFTVENGEFMVLVGPSGCGKSTLLRVIAGLEELTGGNIWVDDRLVNDLLPKERDMAMVFQNYALYPHLKVYDNIAFGLRRAKEGGVKIGIGDLKENILRIMTRSLPKKMRYLPKKERSIAKRVKEVAKLLQIENLLDRYPKELSGGQKQRVALGRAIARNPKLFLMDEPLSNLDAKLRAETRSQIVKLQRQLKTSTIYVTHDRVEAMTMGDRIAVMNEGEIQQIAEPLEIYDRPANVFVAEFIGSPPMNFIKVRVENCLNIIHAEFNFTLPEVWRKTIKSYNNRAILLGIRPEDFQIKKLEKEGNLKNNFKIKVEGIEALGNETYIAFYIGRDPANCWQARISPDWRIQPGEEIYLSIVRDKIHLFEIETGRAIGLERVNN